MRNKKGVWLQSKEPGMPILFPFKGKSIRVPYGSLSYKFSISTETGIMARVLWGYFL